MTETDRLKGFSDAFFAIAITLLVLEFKVPEASPGQLLPALLELWPSLVAFLFSFCYIGIIWLNHHALFSHIRYVNHTVHWINLGILSSSILLGFPTAVLADAFRHGNSHDQGVAVVLYALSAAFMSIAWIPVFFYFQRHPELLHDHSSPTFFRKQRIRPWVGIIGYLFAAVIGQFLPVLGLLAFLIILIYHAATSEGLPAA